MPKKVNTDQDKINEITTDLQRVQAEFINYKTRAEKERQDALALGKEFIINELLPVFDNIQRAFNHTPESLKDNPWVKGIMSLEKQLTSTLQSIGLNRIETIEKPFDPITMEAVSVEDLGGEEEIVSTELQAGYIYGGKVIRPAMVQLKK
jgi:molecular chaperone GrpE